MGSINVEQFFNHGFVVIRHWLTGQTLTELQLEVDRQVKLKQEPYELESEVGYPGAPLSALAIGGQTTRRLLQAYDRDFIFQKIATSAAMNMVMQQLLKSEQVSLSRNHHNCIMTKSPEFSSHTGWHQDYRYWQFQRSNLVSAWIALGDEHKNNGGMQLIPGSHNMHFTSDQFDQQQFFISSGHAQQSIIEQATSIELKAGDALFFHANTLHCAGKNHSQHTKYALVFTYHEQDNEPIAGSKSAKVSSINL